MLAAPSRSARRAPVGGFVARVLGAGPTGALAALALVDAGWSVELRDPLSAEALGQRRRAYAFTQSSRELLERLNLWALIEPQLIPFDQLQLWDLGADRVVAFSPADLAPRQARSGSSAIGWIGRHDTLMPLLLRCLAASDAVRLQLGPEAVPDPEASQRVDLVIAADGPNSATRSRLGVGSWRRTYRQACLTAEVSLRGAVDTQAWELLRPEGPFAVLPLGERRFQLVWSAPTGRAHQLESLPASAFLDRLAGVLPDRFQIEDLFDQPRAYPVELLIAHRLHRNGTLLVGESAHRCHPVGGQGLNLCWRDVAVLHQLARRVTCGQLSLRRLGDAYGRRRWPDLLLTLLATDLLVRIFSNRSQALLPLRRLALGLLARWPRLRRFSLAVMSSGPCAIQGSAPE
ncbi:MAG: FAD-dependent monooxygenase [Cyanobacteria bacterium]|nr:FAD-dependent monooxygenase [Cyanobacteriota bacterium]